MRTARRVIVYMVLITWLLAMMDWKPIHETWWNYGQWPAWAGGSFARWSEVRRWTALVLCPPCGALSENFYFVLMVIEAGEAEQRAVHPMSFSGNPFLPDGPRFWWGQGEGAPWRPVPMLCWYLYWLPTSVLWWVLYAGDLLAGRLPFWTCWVIAAVRPVVHRIKAIRRPIPVS